MNDCIRLNVAYDFPQAVHHANVMIEKIEGRDFPDRVQIGFFPRGRIEIVEIVNDAQSGAVAEQRFRDMRADESGSSRQ
jgi:hypothetical protein